MKRPKLSTVAFFLPSFGRKTLQVACCSSGCEPVQKACGRFHPVFGAVCSDSAAVKADFEVGNTLDPAGVFGDETEPSWWEGTRINRNDVRGSIFEFDFNGARANRGLELPASSSVDHFVFVIYFCSETAGSNLLKVIDVCHTKSFKVTRKKARGNHDGVSVATNMEVESNGHQTMTDKPAASAEPAVAAATKPVAAAAAPAGPVGGDLVPVQREELLGGVFLAGKFVGMKEKPETDDSENECSKPKSLDDAEILNLCREPLTSEPLNLGNDAMALDLVCDAEGGGFSPPNSSKDWSMVRDPSPATAGSTIADPMQVEAPHTPHTPHTLPPVSESFTDLFTAAVDTALREELLGQQQLGLTAAPPSDRSSDSGLCFDELHDELYDELHGELHEELHGVRRGVGHLENGTLARLCNDSPLSSDPPRSHSRPVLSGQDFHIRRWPWCKRGWPVAAAGGSRTARRLLARGGGLRTSSASLGYGRGAREF
jgi:hypothetical protein